MLSAFKYRIYPRPEQEMRLERSLLSLCDFYNRLRAKKIEMYRQNGVSLTKTALRAIALEERRLHQELLSIYSQAVQNVADRVHVSFKNFFEKRTRFPKSKTPRKYLSMTYPQGGFKIDSQQGIHLFGIGHVRIFIHRPLLGRVKRLTIKRQTGEWYAIFITERNAPPKPAIHTIPEDRIRGADFGLEKFVTLDNSYLVEYPKFLKQSETKIKALQRGLAHKKKGSRRWRQVCFSLSRLHHHVKRQRDDFQNKLIFEIFNKSDVLVLEKLNIAGMLRNHSLSKSISDSAWGKFTTKAILKSEMLGKHLIAVDPWGTTQYCYACLTWVPKDLAEREHSCPECGTSISRDHNSSLLIKRLGILSSPPSDGGSSLAEPRPLPSLRGMASRGDEAGSHRVQPVEDVT